MLEQKRYSDKMYELNLRLQGGQELSLGVVEDKAVLVKQLEEVKANRREVLDKLEKTKEELQKEGEVYSKKLDQFRKGLEKKHFEIRHIKTHTWMNGRICKVEDISKQKSRYDPRLICTIKGNEQNGQQWTLQAHARFSGVMPLKTPPTPLGTGG